MIAKIRLWGNEYLVDSVDWLNGKIFTASFEDENKTYHTIHQKRFNSDLDAETNRHSDEPIHADLNEVVIWTKK